MRRVATFVVLSLVVSVEVQARQRGGDNGSDVIPTFAIEANSMRPGEDVRLQACVTNNNPFGSRAIERGTEFTFRFGIGDVLGCEAVHAIGADVPWVDADLQCAVNGNELVLRYIGSAVDWPVGAGACATVAYRAGDRSGTVLTSHSVRDGSFAPAAPAVILLAIDDAIGSIGPPGVPGPMGPPGPAGPAGSAGTGAAAFRMSTDVVQVIGGRPPVAVPGLDCSVSVADGSRLAIWVHANSSFSCPGGGSTVLIAFLLVDGLAVSQAWGSVGTSLANKGWELQWMTEPLAAGPHLLAVQVQAISSASPGALVGCVGSVVDDGHASRLMVIEVLGD